MRKLILLISFYFTFSQLGFSQWIPINPGAGGQVQDVITDPNAPNTLYLASDMEGLYKSTDNGESWQTTGHLIQNRVYAAAVAPGNSNKLVVGTLYGIHMSDDGGDHYSFVEYTRNRTIGVVAFDPNDANRILAGPGWRDDFVGNFGESANGPGEVFLSIDGGTSWSTITFDTDANTDRNVYTIQFDPNNTSNVYMGCAKGAYKSIDGGSTWTKLADPAGTTSNRGVAVSPNGNYLYASYATDGNNRNGYVYATPTSSIAWTQVTAGNGEQIDINDYWYLEVDPRSTGDSHKLIVSLQANRDGLYEGTFDWTGTTLTSYSWDVIWEGNTSFDTGWDWATPNPRFCHYTPSSWARGIWSTTNQTIYRGEPTGSTWQFYNQYSIKNPDHSFFKFGAQHFSYAGRGTESTYTYDVARHDNYMIQGQADNGLVESWDGGVSWANMQRYQDINLSDAQAVVIGDASGTPVVLVQATSGFGGMAWDGRLYAKRLVTHSTSDYWQFIGGGQSGARGIPSGILRDVTVAPSNPSKVFMYSTNNGLYMIDNIGSFITSIDQGGSPTATKIMDATTHNVLNSRKISVHPTNENIVFLSSNGGSQGVWKGENVGGTWSWTKVLNGGGWDAEVTAWEHNGQVYLLYQGKDGSDWNMKLSTDQGATWETIMDQTRALALKTPYWYDEIGAQLNWENKGGSTGFKDNIFVNFYNHTFQIGHGMLRGQIQTDGSVHWEDWTGDLHFTGFTSAVPYTDPNTGKDLLYMATPGAGAWYREIDAFEGGPIVVDECNLTSQGNIPNPPCNFVAVVVDSKKADLTWNDNSNNEDSFEFQKFEEGDQWRGGGSAAADATLRTMAGLTENARFKFRIRSKNTSGSSVWLETDWVDLGGGATQAYDVVSSAGANGSIVPDGTRKVAQGGSMTYAFTGDEGYRVLDVLVDGASVGNPTFYQFDNINANHTISASFELIPTYDMTATAGANGTISSAGVVTVNEGTSKNYVISPDAGYRVENVIVDGVSIGAVSSYTFSDIMSNHSIDVSFVALLDFDITASAGANGSISPSGMTTVQEGTSQTYDIVADAGYQVADVTIDGVSIGVVTSYTFSNIDASHTISATFESEQLFGYGDCGATSAAGIPNPPCNLNVTVTATNRVDLTWIDNSSDETSFEFNKFEEGDQWRGSGSNAANTTMRTLAGLTHNVRFKFRIRAKNSNGSSAWVETTDWVDLSGNTPLTFRAAATSGANGSISPSGIVFTTGGTSETFTMTPDAGYQVADVLVDNVSVGAVSSYTLSNIAGHHSINAIFAAIPPTSYDIVSTPGANGSISPVGIVSVDSSASQTFTMTADAGYEVADVLVDGASVGAVSSYTFSDVDANHTISVSFAEVTATTYDITASAGANGSISPSGTVTIDEGLSQAFTITADAGYEVADVLVDGTSVGAVTSHTFSNVMANHTISASFSASAPAGVGDCSATSPGGKPNPPCGVYGIVTSNSSVTLYWTDNSNNEDYFDIQYQVPGAGFKAAGMPDGAQDATSVAITNLTPDTNHKFRIKAVNATGGSNWVSLVDWLDLSGNAVSHDITASAGANGSISPNGTTSVGENSSQAYTITPDAGYEVSDVLVDGASVGAVTSYTFSNVTATHTISASFSALPTHDITASTGANGSISPSGTVSVIENADQVFTMTADAGYEVADVLVDGASVGAVSSYTFSSVAATHTISVTYQVATTPAGDGDCSATSSGGKPHPPCGFYGQVLSTTSVRLFWTDNSDNENRFNVHRFLDGDTWRGGGMPVPSANSTTVDITNLNSGAMYKFRVKSANTIGSSVWVVMSNFMDLSGGTRQIGEIFEIETEIVEGIYAYPNPSAGQVFIDGAKSLEDLRVFDLYGHVIPVTGQLLSDGKIKLNLDNAGTGMLMIQSISTGKMIRIMNK